VLGQLGRTAAHRLEGRRALRAKQGLHAVAEVVASASVLERLRQIGVHDAQGYQLHLPEPLDTVLAEAMANGPA
jgi:EAL domain-containing protein (putative c-di-GMP-specific phosphodiesterase class I)